MKRRLGHRVIGAVAVAGAVGFLTGCGPEQPWDNALVSTNAAGTGSGNDNSWQPTFSPDGHQVVFQSWASDLGPSPTHTAQLYMRDLDTGAVSVVSAAADGTPGNGVSSRPFFSKDGRKVLFQSFATNLGPHDGDNTSLGEDIYQKDLTTGAVTLVTPNAAGTDTQSFDAQIESVSPDGNRVVFSSNSTDLVTQPVHGAYDVYLRDIAAGTTTLISANAAGTEGGNETSSGGYLSPDGTTVAFASYASDLGPTDTNGTWDVYVRDLSTGTTRLASPNAAGTDSGNLDSFPAGFASDGKLLIGSQASNLGPTDTNGQYDIYLRDLTAGTTSLVSANAAGTDSGNGWSTRPTVSPDGRLVAFNSRASNLGPTDTDKCLVSFNPPVHGPCGDVYIRNLATGTTTLVTANDDNTDSANRTADVEWFTFSPDSTKVLFNTYNGDFGMADDNHAGDVYIRDLAARTTTLVSETPSHTDSGNGASQGGGFSPDGGRVVYWSYASDLGPTSDGNDRVDVYIATFHAADLGVTLAATPEPVPAGGDLTYHQHVESNGPGDADAAVTSLLLPEGTTFADVTTTAGTCDPPSGGGSRLVLCHLGTLAPDETVDITVSAHATAPAGSALVARAAVDAHTADTNTSNDGASVTSHVVP